MENGGTRKPCSMFPHFGYPQTLRLDPDGSFRSKKLEEYCDKHHILLDLFSKAHWKLGVCKRTVQSVKHAMECMAQGENDISAQDALSEAFRALNHRDTIRGFSPVQHVLGRAPDEAGRFFTPLNPIALETILDSERQDMEQQHHRRMVAEQSFLEWQAKDRLTRASASKHHRASDFSARDMVYLEETTDRC